MSLEDSLILYEKHPTPHQPLSQQQQNETKKTNVVQQKSATSQNQSMKKSQINQQKKQQKTLFDVFRIIDFGKEVNQLIQAIAKVQIDQDDHKNQQITQNQQIKIDKQPQKLDDQIINFSSDFGGREQQKQKANNLSEVNVSMLSASREDMQNLNKTPFFGREDEVVTVKQIKSQKQEHEPIEIQKQNNSKFKQRAQKLAQTLQQIEKSTIYFYFNQLKQLKTRTKTPNQSSQKNSTQKKQERSNSALLGQRMSSAESQRLRSAISQKTSEHDQSFNLDLTIRTRNSKNTFQIGRGDSLIYSAESGFGLHPSSPNKTKRSNIESQGNGFQMDDFIQSNQSKDILASQVGKRSLGLHKSFSQNVQLNVASKKPKRLFSSKEKIEQFQENQNEHEDYSKKQLGQHQQNNLTQSVQILSEQVHHENHEQIRNSKQNSHKDNNQINQSQKEIYQNKSKMSIRSQKSLNKSKDSKQQHKQNVEDEKYSVRQGTIVDDVGNFDADDQQISQQQQKKQLVESANFSKNKSSYHILKKRVDTEIQKNMSLNDKNIAKRFNKVDISKLEQDQSQSQKNSRAISHKNLHGNIFATEINNYQHKILKIKQEKQNKKRKLQQQLAKINNQLNVLHIKNEQQGSPQLKNNYVSRVKISDNNQAKKKAQNLVKNLRSQKRNRNIARLQGFQNIDKNINQYMEQLNQIRYQNQEKVKQKKKLQILQRMKQNQLRKLNDKKKTHENQKFVVHLKGAVSLPNNKGQVYEHKAQLLKRSPTKQELTQQNQNQNQFHPSEMKNLTPELNEKKAYLNRLRGLSAKKSHSRDHKKDIYEQLLS